jgi:PAS domain S-box-containing protein
VSEPPPERDRLNKIEALPHSYDEEIKKALISAGNPVALLEMAHDAIIVRDTDSVVQFWNRGATDLYGWTPDEAKGHPTHTLLDTTFPPSSSKEDVGWALINLGHWEGELSHRRKDGSRIRVSSRQALRRNEDGKPVFVLEINRDIAYNSYLKLLQEVAVSASESRTIQEAVNRCLTSICSHTGWCVGRACLITTGDGGEINCSSLWYLSELKRFDAFREFSEKNPLALVEGLAGRVMKCKEPVWISSTDEDPYFSTGKVAREAGIKSAFGLPVIAGSEIVTVLELFSENPMKLNEGFRDVLANVGRQLGRVFERVTAEEAQRRLSASLLRSQDDERRRIARELHDSAGQYLAGMRMCIDQARRGTEKIPRATAEKLDEAAEMAKRCESEVRTLSYLLHPPLLEELGLASAANWFTEGFSARSGVQVRLDVSPSIGRMDQLIELTLFRILQECLTNIHRHSGSRTATVKISADSQQVSLQVTDEGKGIPKRTLERWSVVGPQLGVGISGMRERVKDLGGTLRIEADETGTTVKATVPTSTIAAQ